MPKDPKQQFGEAVGRKAREPQRKRPMVLGKGDGSGDVDAGNGYVWVHTPGRPAYKVVNRIAPLIDGLDVIVGKDPHTAPWIEQILDVPARAGVPESRIGVPPHHATHEYLSSSPGGGSDVTWINVRQWTPLLVLPYTAMVVTIYSGRAYTGGVWHQVPEQTLGLGSYIPAAGLIRFAVIYVDTDGTIGVNAGTAVPMVPGLTDEDLPDPLADTVSLCAVRLYGGQTELVETSTHSDFDDLRGFGSRAGQTGGTGTAGRVARWIDAATLGDSIIRDDGSTVGVGTAPATDKVTVSGSLSVTGQLKSTQATGTAPLAVSSTTAVTNLNADMVDGQHASAFGAPLTVKEEDGAPSVSSVTEIRVTNGKLTDNGGGSVSLDLSSGAPGSITVEELDGVPSVAGVSTIKVTNGKLTDDTGGVVTLDLAGVTDHGALTGLADDDHTQYLNNTRHDTTLRHTLGTVVPHDAHGDLTGIGTDDHHAKSHTHNTIDGTPKLDQANTHESADTDAGTSSLHHTLGTGEFQAAAGNHTHLGGGGVGVQNNGSAVGTEPSINFIPGANISLGISDDAGNSRVNVTISGAGGASGAVSPELALFNLLGWA